MILIRFTTQALDGLSDGDLDAYERLIAENDQELFSWMSGVVAAPDHHAPMVSAIRATLEQK